MTSVWDYVRPGDYYPIAFLLVDLLVGIRCFHAWLSAVFGCTSIGMRIIHGGWLQNTASHQSLPRYLVLEPFEGLQVTLVERRVGRHKSVGPAQRIQSIILIAAKILVVKFTTVTLSHNYTWRTLIITTRTSAENEYRQNPIVGYTCSRSLLTNL